MDATKVITTANLKGGTAKTTSTVFLAEAFRREGYRVKIADADPQQSSLDWAGLETPVLGLATATLHRQFWNVIDRDTVDVVIIDTPPVEANKGIVASAMRVATDILIPMAPTMMELKRFGPVWDTIADAAGFRDDDPDVVVLLNRTVANAASTEVIRATLEGQQRIVLATEVPRLELYAQAFGQPVPKDKHYAAVADEFLARWGWKAVDGEEEAVLDGE
ncbi:ParA family protein [Glycomyces artemisiae]|uniref:Plasmid segregation oscillating ATPase ParF n=1 Tax=Glycomyces artemisiae TaxID=1076443 RepID=A0A2T0U6I0_9ACTN|nr:ParA family protein [Glycomyces artemisiae]PRY53519.1 plasmid segregation oscillating ATPase ParF [Glycomyces artemisiae]